MKRMQGRVVLVTGAASGIGLAAAEALAEEGAALALMDVDSGGLDAAVSRCRGRGAQAVASVGDVGEAGDVTRAFDEASALGRIDGVFNNAGISSTCSFTETTDAEWARLVRTNLTGSFNVARAAARVLSATELGGAGALVNTASELALVGQPGYVAYSATKGGVLAMTRALAAELAPAGVRVNALCPGETDTDMLDREFAAAEDPAAERQAHERSIPMGRIASPEEIAAAAVYLLSRESSYLTGTALVVDGGRTSCMVLDR